MASVSVVATAGSPCILDISVNEESPSWVADSVRIANALGLVVPLPGCWVNIAKSTDAIWLHLVLYGSAFGPPAVSTQSSCHATFSHSTRFMLDTDNLSENV